MDAKLVVHFFWSLHNGGVETLMRSLARSRTSYLFCLNDSVVEGEDFKEIFNIASLRGIIALINVAFKRPVWHFHDYNLYRWFKFLPGLKILQLHNIETSEILSVTSKTKITVVSETVQKYYTGRIKDCKKELVVIEPSIDIPDIDGVDEKQDRFVVIGRLHEIKGQLTLLNSIKKSPKFADIQIDLIGDGEDFVAIRALIRDEGLSNIRMLGSMSYERIFETLPSYKGVIVPSEFETFGLIVIEAIASKVPVLIRDVNHLKQFDSLITYPCLWSTIDELHGLIQSVGSIKMENLNTTYMNFKSSFDTAIYVDAINNFYEGP